MIFTIETGNDANSAQNKRKVCTAGQLTGLKPPINFSAHNLTSSNDIDAGTTKHSGNLTHIHTHRRETARLRLYDVHCSYMTYYKFIKLSLDNERLRRWTRLYSSFISTLTNFECCHIFRLLSGAATADYYLHRFAFMQSITDFRHFGRIEQN